MRLREQYTMVIGGLVCLSLLVLGAALLVEQRRYAREVGMVAAGNLGDTLERQIEKHGIALATGLAERIVAPLTAGDLRQITVEAAELRSYPDVSSAAAVDANGFLVRDGNVPANDDDDDHVDLPWVREALATGKPSSRREGRTLRVAAPVLAGKTVLGAAMLDMGMDGIRSDILIEQARLDGLIRSQSTAFSLTGITLGIMLASISVLCTIGVAGSLSRPVVAFAARARRIGRGELVQSEHLQRRDKIGDLSRAFDEMAAALRRTTVSRNYFDNVLRSMADMLLVTDADGNVLDANPRCLAELGCDEESLRGRHAQALLPQLGSLAEASAAATATAAPRWFALQRPGGGQIPVRVSAAPLRDPRGALSGYVLVMQNIAERLAAEKQIERSLGEKEVLLREIHHRVKNNLQIVSSMLNLQAERSSDDGLREIFHGSEVRIRAMALVHEQLYRSADLAHVDLARYLDTLAQQVVRYFGRDDCRVEVRVDDGVRDVSVDQAIPIGLIVNELIANAVKHGFTPSHAGLVTVRLTGDGAARVLTVSDNGAGFPAGLDIAGSDSLGLKLVQALTEQLGGSLSMTGDGGARFVVELPALVLEADGEAAEARGAGVAAA